MNSQKFENLFVCFIFCVFIFTACGDRNPAKAKIHVNYGSGMQISEVGINFIRKYAETNGFFPKADVKLIDLSEDFPREVAGSLQYGGNETLTLKSPKNLILLKFIHPTPTANGNGFYCALLSGKVVFLSENDAVLGKQYVP